jgi:hypothetical protein
MATLGGPFGAEWILRPGDARPPDAGLSDREHTSELALWLAIGIPAEFFPRGIPTRTADSSPEEAPTQPCADGHKAPLRHRPLGPTLLIPHDPIC